MPKQEKAESVVREIRRKTRKKYSAKKESVLSLKACEARKALLPCVGVKGLIPTCTISGARLSLMLASVV